MTIDISKIQPGDTVTITATVVRAEPHELVGVCTNAGRVIAVSESDIISHTPKPKPIAVGDRIRTGEDSDVYTVTAMDNDEAWLKGPGGYHITASISGLKRVSDPASTP